MALQPLAGCGESRKGGEPRSRQRHDRTRCSEKLTIDYCREDQTDHADSSQRQGLVIRDVGAQLIQIQYCTMKGAVCHL